MIHPADLVPKDDDAFLRAAEGLEIPHEAWSHRNHIRLAYCYVRRHGLDEGLRRVRATIQALNVKHNVPTDVIDRGYHETVTVAWMRVVAATIRSQGAGVDSNEFCEKQPHVCQRTLLRLFYSRDRIMNWDAKRAFVEPDLIPLP